MQPVYIAAMTTRLPKLYAPDESIDILYPQSVAEGRINRLAKKAAKGIGIQWRPSILSRECFPVRKVATPEYEPVNWCVSIAEELARPVGMEQVGQLSVSYNISSDPNVLPSVAARVAAQTGVVLDTPAEERAFYGCAGSLYSLESAVNYCRNSSHAAVVCTFDQCSWIVNTVHDMQQSDFKDHLRTSLLFSDGAAGMLVIPEVLRSQVKTPLMKILDIATAFVPGNSVRMESGHLILGEDIKDAMPDTISSLLVKPMLARHALTVSSIDEWSIHQGGLPILTRFTEPETLGLPDEKIARSRELFQLYGNFSAPSCLFVLNSFFSEDKMPKAGKKGMMLSFGAGYYLGAMLYEWVANG